MSKRITPDNYAIVADAEMTGVRVRVMSPNNSLIGEVLVERFDNDEKVHIFRGASEQPFLSVSFRPNEREFHRQAERTEAATMEFESNKAVFNKVTELMAHYRNDAHTHKVLTEILNVIRLAHE